MTSLHNTAIKGNIKILKKELRSVRNINLFDSEGFTPLFWACFHGHQEIVKYLLKQGANVNLSRNRLRPLHVAAIGGHLNVIKILFKAGVNADVLEYKGDRTPLHWAAQEGQIQAGRLLIKNGANINKLNAHGETPLLIATGEGNINFVEMLFKNGVDVNKYPKNAYILQRACAWNHLEIVKLLLKHGAK